MLAPLRDAVTSARSLESRTRHALLDSGEALVLRSLDAALTSRLAHEVVDRVLASELAEHAVATALRAPLVEATIDGPDARRLVAEVIESGVVDEAVARLLENEEIWVLVDEIARSPAVTDAISHQGIGLADQVAEVVRDRSRSADARLERVARRLLRRDARAAGNGALTTREE